MHKVTTLYDDGTHRSRRGFMVNVYCSLVGSYTEVAFIQDPADTLRFANWKAIELGVEVELCWELEKVLGIVKKEIKKGKKRKEKK